MVTVCYCVVTLAAGHLYNGIIDLYYNDRKPVPPDGSPFSVARFLRRASPPSCRWGQAPDNDVIWPHYRIGS